MLKRGGGGGGGESLKIVLTKGGLLERVGIQIFFVTFYACGIENIISHVLDTKLCIYFS